jgi:hypothetical protein
MVQAVIPRRRPVAAGRVARAGARTRLLDVGASLVALGGLVSAATGVYFLVGNHPFHRAGEFAEEFGMTRAQVEAVNPEIAHWVMHVSDQVGAVSLGWGLFLVLLAAFGLRLGHRPSWLALWAAGLPTLLFAAFGEVTMFGHLDEGSLLSMGVLVLFLVGMLLPAREFLARPATERRPD